MAQPVKLYVYDLSQVQQPPNPSPSSTSSKAGPRELTVSPFQTPQGMARQFSLPFLGIHLDAIYHTSVVLRNREYYFGQGIQISSPPGVTHHGAPLEVLDMGATELPEELVGEYLADVADQFSAQKYDLFRHNCNHFADRFVTFLVGEGIPKHIVSLPERVLQTPFGAMLKPQIDAAMRPVTQAPTLNDAGANGTAGHPPPARRS